MNLIVSSHYFWHWSKVVFLNKTRLCCEHSRRSEGKYPNACNVLLQWVQVKKLIKMLKFSQVSLRVLSIALQSILVLPWQVSFSDEQVSVQTKSYCYNRRWWFTLYTMFSSANESKTVNFCYCWGGVVPRHKMLKHEFEIMVNPKGAPNEANFRFGKWGPRTPKITELNQNSTFNIIVGF